MLKAQEALKEPLEYSPVVSPLKGDAAPGKHVVKKTSSGRAAEGWYAVKLCRSYRACTSFLHIYWGCGRLTGSLPHPFFLRLFQSLLPLQGRLKKIHSYDIFFKKQVFRHIWAWENCFGNVPPISILKSICTVRIDLPVNRLIKWPGIQSGSFIIRTGYTEKGKQKKYN